MDPSFSTAQNQLQIKPYLSGQENTQERQIQNMERDEGDTKRASLELTFKNHSEGLVLIIEIQTQ